MIGYPSNFFIVDAPAGVPSFLVNYPGALFQSQQFLVDNPRGNHLLTTSYIVDMNMPRLPQGAKAYASGGKMRDEKGRRIHWELA